MSGLGIDVKFDTKKVERAINQTVKRIKNPEHILSEIADTQIEDAEERIRTTKTSPDGHKWEPWSYETMKQRNRAGDAHKGLLYRSGKLLQRFAKRVRKTTVTIFNKAPYAGYLQKGTKDMPARPFMGWSKDSIKETKKEIYKWISKDWK